jgi:AraC-like DNA-binding protein
MPSAPVNHVQYFSPAPEVTRLALYCLDAGAAHVSPGRAYPPLPEAHPREFRAVAAGGRTLGEYQLLYVARGEGWLELKNSGQNGDNVRRPVGAGTAILLRPGEWHRYSPSASTGWQEYWIGFRGAGVPGLLALLGLASTHTTEFGYSAGEELERLFARVIALAVDPGPLEQAEMAGVAQQILSRVARMHDVSREGAEGDSDPIGDLRFDRARDVMLRRIGGSVDMALLQSTAGCSKSTLQRLFLRRTGMSPYRHYMTLKVNAAKWELAHTRRAIKEIAREYGFSDQYHFSRVFTDIAGVRPSRWRSDHGSRAERT